MLACITFLASVIASAYVSYGEPLRRVKGEEFLIVWPLCSLFVLVLVGMILWWRNDNRGEMLKQKIKNASINHTDIPHLLAGEFRSMGIEPTPSIQTQFYYLLRLYLRGIVRYDHPRLYIDEAKLEAVKAEGGRHSEVAACIVTAIRRNGNCTMMNAALSGAHVSIADHELYMGYNKKRAKFKRLVSVVLSALLGLAWGVLLAKLNLGMTYGKPVEFLILMIIIGGPISIVLLKMCILHICEYRSPVANTSVHEWVDALKRAPHAIDKELVEKVGHSLPKELERNTLLNAFFIDMKGFVNLADQMEERSFMYQFSKELREAFEVARMEEQKLREELEAKRKEREKKLAEQSDSGCTSCSSCSSCSSCGGCGGCGD